MIGYEDFIANNGEQGAKDAGRWRLEGKDYMYKTATLSTSRFQRVTRGGARRVSRPDA